MLKIRTFMDKKEIIKTFFEHNVLLSPELLEKVNENNINEILSRAKQSKTAVVTELEQKPTSLQEILFEVKKTTQNKRLSAQDFAKYYNNKYEGIKNILLKKIGAEKDIVSINKTKNTFSDVLVIGMVRELTPQGFILEDPTGETDVISEEKTDPDDVVGVKGSVRENKLFAKEVTVPDIPLSREITKIDASVFLTTEAIEHPADFTIVSNIDRILDVKNTTNRAVVSANPSWVSISKDNKKLNIIVYKSQDEADKNKAISYLKKRHLSPQRNQIMSQEDPFLLNPIPDILWLVQKESWAENYKGVSIISGTAPVKINLETRNVEFVKEQPVK